MKFYWHKSKGYECSSKGDKRFSPFFAILEDGRSIEVHYQCDVKGYDVGGTDWKVGKGKPPLTDINLFEAYLDLWKQWAKNNPDLIEELRQLAKQHNYMLTDRFATTEINQANALSIILNETQRNFFKIDED